MDEIIGVNTLPDPIRRLAHSDRVRVHKENGIIMLMPIQDLHKGVSEGKPHMKFVGALSQESYDEINAALSQN